MNRSALVFCLALVLAVAPSSTRVARGVQTPATPPPQTAGGGRGASSLGREGSVVVGNLDQSGATGITKTTENDQGLALSTNWIDPTRSPPLGKPVAT